MSRHPTDPSVAAGLPDDVPGQTPAGVRVSVAGAVAAVTRAAGHQLPRDRAGSPASEATAVDTLPATAPGAP